MRPVYCNAFETDADLRLGSTIEKVLKKENVTIDNIVILCIGSDRATGDCLGPLVGAQLKNALPNIAVFGTLECPVHAMNLESTVETIYELYNEPFIIAIDASLGISRHVGYVSVFKGSLRPGIGVNKSLPDVGDISITGIVNEAGSYGHILIQNTRLSLVMTLVDFICEGLLCS